MKSKFILFIINIIIISGIYAQDNKKKWEEGKLTWDDFQEKTISIDNSELSYVLDTALTNRSLMTQHLLE